MTSSTVKPLNTRAVIVVRDVQALQRRVRAFAGTPSLQTAPTSYHR
jgi:hypothetical protein